MTRNIVKSKASQGEALGKLNGSLMSIKNKVDALSSLMRERYFVIYPMYGELGYEIVIFIKGKRGKGVWEQFLINSAEVNAVEGETFKYYAKVTEAFDLATEYTEYDIISTVLDVRKALGMELLTEQITDTCMNTFRSLFLVKSELADNADGKGEHVVYTPNIAVLISKKN